MARWIARSGAMVRVRAFVDVRSQAEVERFVRACEQQATRERTRAIEARWAERHRPLQRLELPDDHLDDGPLPIFLQRQAG